MAASLPAQEKQTTQLEPKTKLEAFDATTGVVIIRGFSAIGGIQGQLNTSAEVECKEFTNATSGKKEYGIVIKVKDTSRIERNSSSFIDYDEIDSLIKGIDYITKIDKSVTKLSSFQADYKTKGALVVSTYNDSSGKIQAAVESGRFGSVRAYITLVSLAQFRGLIQQAKSKLDLIRQ
jgi:hypothetical protein